MLRIQFHSIVSRIRPHGELDRENEKGCRTEVVKSKISLHGKDS